MADRFRVTGVPPYDGEYEISLEQFFNGDELHFIKKRSGVRAGELEEAFRAGDYDVILGIAVIAMERAGVTVDPDVIWKAQLGKIEFIADEEADAGPPASTPPPANDERRSGDEKPGSSGDSSRPTGAPPANDLSRTGIPDSATGATSAHETSVA